MADTSPTELPLVLGGILSPAGQAQYDRGYMMYRSNEAVSALQAWLPLAEAGHAESQYQIALLYESGEATGANLTQAIQWLSLAATNGYVTANCRLGTLLQNNGDVSTKVIQSWFRRGADAGSVLCMNDLAVTLLKGEGGTRDISAGIRWLTLAAESGNLDSQAKLGEILFRGSYGVRRDLVRAREWLLKVCDQPGFVNETSDLAYMLQNGIGGVRDITAAVRYFTKAAEAGHAQSASNLGLIYRYGDGVPKNNEQAAKYFRRAQALGYMSAAVYLGDLYFLGEGVEHDREAAFALYRQAANADITVGYCRIAAMMLYGEGVRRDVKAAGDLEAKVRAKMHGANCRTPLSKLLQR